MSDGWKCIGDPENFVWVYEQMKGEAEEEALIRMNDTVKGVGLVRSGVGSMCRENKTYPGGVDESHYLLNQCRFQNEAGDRLNKLMNHGCTDKEVFVDSLVDVINSYGYLTVGGTTGLRQTLPRALGLDPDTFEPLSGWCAPWDPEGKMAL